MPIYEYYCERCDCLVERLQKLGEGTPSCPTNRNKTEPCGLLKIMSKTSFRLKGSGWYKDGYQKKEKGKS
jgi:putative FmdB family regulatory protein